MRLSTLLFPLSATLDGVLATVRGRERVLQGVALYFGTPRGARCMVPEFGYPPLGFYDGDTRGWAREAEEGLRLVAHVTGARVDVTLGEDGVLRGTATVQTDAGEEVEYDVAVNAA